MRTATGLLLAATLLGCTNSVVAPTAEPTLEPTALPISTPELTLAPTQAPIDPCALITQDEANHVAGVQLQSPQPAGQPPVRCVWPTPLTGSVAQVEIDVGDGAKKSYDIDNLTLKHDFTTVSGLGDEAYAEAGAIFFRKGDTWVAIHLLRLDAGTNDAASLEQLARIVAGRV